MSILAVLVTDSEGVLAGVSKLVQLRFHCLLAVMIMSLDGFPFTSELTANHLGNDLE